MTEWKRGEKYRVIREMYNAGHSIEEIAKAVGLKESSVKAYLPKVGIFRGRQDYLGLHTEEILKMRDEGMTLDEISEQIGFSACRICSHLTELGYGKKRFLDYGEEDLIDENTVYAERRIEKPEKIIDGKKKYTTIPLSEICGG